MSEPDFDRWSLVLLRRGPRAGEYDGEALQRLQEQHLAHLRAMAERGVRAVAGPFDEQDDETLRGICLYRTDLDETRRLAESDPSVQAGRMAVELVSWFTEKGRLTFRP